MSAIHAPPPRSLLAVLAMLQTLDENFLLIEEPIARSCPTPATWRTDATIAQADPGDRVKLKGVGGE
jgi:hypothetical protein